LVSGYAHVFVLLSIVIVPHLQMKTVTTTSKHMVQHNN